MEVLPVAEPRVIRFGTRQVGVVVAVFAFGVTSYCVHRPLQLACMELAWSAPSPNGSPLDLLRLCFFTTRDDYRSSQVARDIESGAAHV